MSATKMSCMVLFLFLLTLGLTGPRTPSALAIPGGYWEEPFNHGLSGSTSYEAIHMALIPASGDSNGLTGKVLVWSFSQTSGYTDWSIVDPVNQTFTDYRGSGTNPGISMPSGEGDLFCAGHAWDAHGRLFVAGGQRQLSDADTPVLGGRLAYLFDPSQTGGSGASSTQWIQQSDRSGVMAKSRYYPTVIQTASASGSMLVIGGTENIAQPDENNYETFAVGLPGSGSQGTWQTHTSGTRLFPGPARTSSFLVDEFSQYDYVHLLSTGDLFRSGISDESSRWTHADTSAPSGWVAPGSHTPNGEYYRIYGTAVLAPNFNSSFQDTIIVMGGETVFEQTVTNSVKWSKASATSSGAWPNGYSWSTLASLNHERADACAVLLPTGGVLVLNGRRNPAGSALDPVKVPELFRNGQWTEQTACEVVFDHHHCAVLLPSGKILVGGGDNRDYDYAVYVPEYLTLANKPTWSSAPTSPMTLGSSTQYTANFTIAAGAVVEKVVLIAPGSNTHAIDMHQRYVQLQIVSSTSTSITYTAPTSAAHAPKGWYMMFLVSGTAVPSEARWVQLQ